MPAPHTPAPDAPARKPKVTAAKYERYGTALAIAPKAFFESYWFTEETKRENEVVGDAVIVDIRDPLEQRAHWRFDSYEEINARIAAACATAARAVILRFDSPGGEAAGAFESARAARALCDAAGKAMHAYVEGDCCSAAYAYASVCDSITIGETAITGSIGVIMCREDLSGMNAANGIRVAFIQSGARKADGHPDNPITDAELASLQSVIDAMGLVFFEHVSNTRGLAVESVAQLEARMFDAQAAVAAGLADAVGSLTTLLASIAGGDDKGLTAMPSPYEKARTALEEAAKTDDANGSAARAALAAMDAASGGGGGDGDDKPADPPAGDPPPEKKTDAAGDPPPTKDDEGKKTAAAAYRAAIQATADTAALRAELKLEREKNERRDLIASRPGMDAAMTALLEKAPIELVREHIKAMPAKPINPQLGRPPMQGDSQQVAGLDPAEKAKLDERMGLTPKTSANVSTPTKLTLSARGRQPAPTPPAPGEPLPGAPAGLN